MKIGGIDLSFPVFFPSVSSVKTALPPLDYVRLLSALRGINGQFLVSAFDLAHAILPDQQALRDLLGCVRNPGTVVIMDSGNYESFWKGAQDRWSQTDSHNILRSFPCALAFGFDEQSPPHDHSNHVRLIIDRFNRDQAAASDVTIVPIIHGRAQTLPVLCAEVARISGAPMIAVPERRLDDYSVKEAFNSNNADSIRQQIREKIDKTSVTIVYLSENSANSEWVNWEIEESLKRGKGVIGVYKAGGPRATLPKAFTDNALNCVQWTHKNLVSALEETNRKRTW